MVAKIRAPIGFGIYRIEPIGNRFRSVNISKIYRTEKSVNLPIGNGKSVTVSVFSVYQTDLPIFENELSRHPVIVERRIIARWIRLDETRRMAV